MANPPAAWVVEDERSLRDALRALLDDADGLRCGGAFGSVEEALAAPGPEPDLLLLDVNLPGMNGVEGVSALKTRFPAARVVMLTIRDDAPTISAALEAGASGYLLKGAGADEIEAALHAALAGGMLMPAPVARMVMDRFRRRPAPAPDYGLTERERDVLQEMVGGWTQKEIADRLFVSVKTVNKHVQRIYEKLHVGSGNAAVAKAVRERLVEEGGPA